MKLTTKARLTSTVLLGVVGGVAQHLYELKQFGITRDAFLMAQAARYDRVVGLHHPLSAAVVAGIVIVAVVRRPIRIGQFNRCQDSGESR